MCCGNPAYLRFICVIFASVMFVIHLIAGPIMTILFLAGADIGIKNDGSTFSTWYLGMMGVCWFIALACLLLFLGVCLHVRPLVMAFLVLTVLHCIASFVLCSWLLYKCSQDKSCMKPHKGGLQLAIGLSVMDIMWNIVWFTAMFVAWNYSHEL